MTRSQGSWDVEVEILINKNTAAGWQGPAGHHRWQPRQDHEGTVGLVLVGSQVVGMADGRLQSDCVLEDWTRLSTVCSRPHCCDT